ncbi:ROK family protein [Litoribacter ruber]|uniref:ROK family protein n=1 Tax=Litoribacter ruber TaxID=702568 RepID=UPI001BDB689B|nr:ROK family protein [Litoribacter ruber]MBT0811938.1 ROK family protein [Litoribacter ruber]
MSNLKTMGIDIGGSHFTSGFVNLHNLAIIPHTFNRVDLKSNGSVEGIISAWANAIMPSLGEEGFDGGIGIAFPGPFDYPNGISKIKDQGKFQHLYNLNIKNLLADQLNIGAYQIKFINDAACFLQGEVISGVAKGSKSAIGLTLGTGLGSAFFLDGKAADAALWESPFKEGIAEDYFSTAWFLGRYIKLTGFEAEGVKELAFKADRNPVLRALFEEFGKNLAEFLIPQIEEHKPETIVLGGNISKAHKLFLPATQAVLKQNKIETSIKITELGEWATIVGAATFSHNCQTQ